MHLRTFFVDILISLVCDFSISFLRVIIVQDFDTVSCYVLFVYKLTSLSSQFNSLFILYISTAKPFCLVKGYIEVKINEHEIL